jgi:hypothetical protein
MASGPGHPDLISGELIGLPMVVSTNTSNAGRFQNRETLSVSVANPQLIWRVLIASIIPMTQRNGVTNATLVTSKFRLA